MMLNRREVVHDLDLATLSAKSVDEYQQAVREQYPAARWIPDQEFGRIVAGHLLLSLRFSLIDPLAEAMAWRDAAQRLGEAVVWNIDQPLRSRRGALLSGRRAR